MLCTNIFESKNEPGDIGHTIISHTASIGGENRRNHFSIYTSQAVDRDAQRILICNGNEPRNQTKSPDPKNDLSDCLFVNGPLCN